MAQQQSQNESSKPTPSEEKIHITIRNRTRVLFDDDVKSISSKNDTGIFDVLPEHSNFISLISSPLTVRTLDGKKQEITFTNGLLKVKDNKVYCYVDLLVEEMRATMNQNIKQ